MCGGVGSGGAGGFKCGGLMVCLHSGDVPLEVSVREGGDVGKPVTVSDSGGQVASSFHRIAERIWEKLQHEQGSGHLL